MFQPQTLDVQKFIIFCGRIRNCIITNVVSCNWNYYDCVWIKL